MIVIGMMCGTSHDSIDAAAVRITPHSSSLFVENLGMVSRPYSTSLRKLLVDALPPNQTSMKTVCELDTRIGQEFGEVAQLANDSICEGAADVVVSHGQTVYHWVNGRQVKGSLQLGQPAWIAEKTGLTVVSDLRSRDIATGGQGAPLVSLIDSLWLHGTHAAVVNLGGISNATIVRTDAAPCAFDIGPANALIDAAAYSHTNGAASYDPFGQGARRGTIDFSLLELLQQEPYFRADPPKTTGKELFHADYLARKLAGRSIALNDLLATLVELTAWSIGVALAGIPTVYFSGGGTRNTYLMERIGAHLPDATIALTSARGFDSDSKEAVSWAILGYLSLHRKTGNLPSCTGASRQVILGTIIPGEKMLSLDSFPAPREILFHP